MAAAVKLSTCHLLLLIWLCPTATFAASIGAPSVSSAPDCMFVWMASVGISPSRISNFTQLLVQDEIDQEVLEILTLEQLEKLGIPMGPRSLIFNAAQSGIDVCKFGSTCGLAESSFQCSCVNGTSGPLCETVESCWPGLCKHEGSCVSNGSSTSCVCLPGFTGDQCQISVLCEASPCLNGGTCHVNSLGGYSCTCPLGYGGVNCENVWFSEDILTGLIKMIEKLTIDVKGATLLYDIKIKNLENAIASLQALVKELNGPRLFAAWSTLTLGSIKDLSYLRIEGKELAVVITTSHISVYEIMQSSFTLLQNMSSADTHGVRAFSVGSRHCIAVAAHTSKLFCWNALTQQFDSHQEFRIIEAVHVELASVASRHFLVFSYGGVTSPSVFLWSTASDRFLLYQLLPTAGSHSYAAPTTTSAGTFVGVAQIDNSSHSSLAVFKLNKTGSYFEHVQSFDSADSVSLFAGGDYAFVISSSAVHMYDSTSGKFVAWLSLPSQQDGLVSFYEYLYINTEHYLVIGSRLDTTSSAVATSSDDSVKNGQVTVYKLSGAQFLPYQTIEVPDGVLALKGFRSSMGSGTNVLAVISDVGVALWNWTPLPSHHN